MRRYFAQDDEATRDQWLEQKWQVYGFDCVQRANGSKTLHGGGMGLTLRAMLSRAEGRLSMSAEAPWKTKGLSER